MNEATRRENTCTWEFTIQIYFLPSMRQSVRGSLPGRSVSGSISYFSFFFSFLFFHYYSLSIRTRHLTWTRKIIISSVIIILVRSVKSREIDGGRDHNTEAHGRKSGRQRNKQTCEEERHGVAEEKRRNTHKIIKRFREKWCNEKMHKNICTQMIRTYTYIYTYTHKKYHFSLIIIKKKNTFERNEIEEF